MRPYSTQPVGDGTLVQKRVVSTQACRIAAVLGVNNGAAAFVQIHETPAEPANAAVPKFHTPVAANGAYSFALPGVIDLAACTIVFSSTLATYTASAGTPGSIQALLAV